MRKYAFLMKYVIMLLLGSGAMVINTGQFYTDISLACLGIIMFYIIAKLAKIDENFKTWIHEDNIE